MNQGSQIIIVGGGLVGCIVGYGLAQAGLTVTILEPQSIEALQHPTHDGRASAIAYGSSKILEGFALWQELQDLAQPIQDILISDNHQPWFVHFSHNMVGDMPMGYILENTFLRQRLVTACLKHPRISWQQGAVAEVRAGSQDISITSQDGATHTAALVIAADGRNSRVRDLCNIPIKSWSYPQKAIVTSVAHAEPHRGVAHEYFFPTGPLALLPMQDPYRSSVVWSVVAESADRLYQASEEDFNTALNHQFGGRLGALKLAGPRWCYPLSVMFARTYVAPRLVLVGDAAHTIHPVAGQGLNLGIRDAEVLVREIVNAWRVGLDFGSQTILASYEKQRFWDNMAMIAATDQCIRLFGANRFGFPYARGAVMGLLHRIPVLKKTLIKQAMGI